MTTVVNKDIYAIYITLVDDDEEWLPIMRQVVGWQTVQTDGQESTIAVVLDGMTVIPASDLEGFVMLADSTTSLAEIVVGCREAFYAILAAAEIENVSPENKAN